MINTVTTPTTIQANKQAANVMKIARSNHGGPNAIASITAIRGTYIVKSAFFIDYPASIIRENSQSVLAWMAKAFDLIFVSVTVRPQL